MKANNCQKFYRQIVCFLALSIGPLGTAAALDLSKERCDVLMGPVCMVLPSNMSLTYEAPFDSRRYRFVKNDQVIVRAYVENSPASIEATQSFSKDVGDFSVKGFKSLKDGIPRVDLVFVPHARNVAAVHVNADFSDGQRAEVVALLAGIRPCHRKSLEELTCPLVSNLGADLVVWLSN